MDLGSFIAKYNGKVVADGQCGNLVRAYWTEVDHTVPPSYTNSKDYWSNPVPGYNKTQTPTPGAIAIYDGHGAFPEGHSAIYVDGRVFEQNADPDGSPAHLYQRANTYLLGYLIKQGEDMVLTPELWESNVKFAYFGGDKACPDALVVNQPLDQALDAINKSPERAARVKALNAQYAAYETAQKATHTVTVDGLTYIKK